jgi:hypothetical protein
MPALSYVSALNLYAGIEKRNGGKVRVIPWVEFEAIMQRGINFFSVIDSIAGEYVKSYDPPNTIRSRLKENEPPGDITLLYDPTNGRFGFISGNQPPQGYKQGKAQQAAPQA